MERLGVLLVASCQENQELRRRRRWARLFDQLDVNKDGRIDLGELRAGLAKRGVSRSSVDKVSRRRRASAGVQLPNEQNNA